jgi:hypothetical protein
MLSAEFIIFSETDVRLLRETNQCQTQEERRNNEKQSGTIGVFKAKESGYKHYGKENGGTNTTVQCRMDTANQVTSAAP